MSVSELSSDDVGFYTAIATAIPVLFVAYTIALSSWAQRLRSSYDVSLKVVLLTVYSFTTRSSLALGRALRALIGGSGSALVLLAAIGVALGLPAVGEIASLHALASGSSSSLTRTLSELGVLAAGVMVAIPILVIVIRTFSLVPVVSIWIQARKDLHEVRSIYDRWQGGGRDNTTWMSPDIAFTFIPTGGGGPTTWNGGPVNLPNFVSSAWGSTYPVWRGASFGSVGKLIVFDRVQNQRRASVFTFVDHKVTQLVAYEDRKQAEKENYGRNDLVERASQES